MLSNHLPVSLSFALYTWPYVPSPVIPMISNLSTQRFPQSISVSFISPYLGPHILKMTVQYKSRKRKSRQRKVRNVCVWHYILRSFANWLWLFIVRWAVWGRWPTRKFRRERQVGQKLTSLSLRLLLSREQAVLQAEKRSSMCKYEYQKMHFNEPSQRIHTFLLYLCSQERLGAMARKE